jgi:hypothetical protein
VGRSLKAKLKGRFSCHREDLVEDVKKAPKASKGTHGMGKSKKLFGAGPCLRKYVKH